MSRADDLRVLDAEFAEKVLGCKPKYLEDYDDYKCGGVTCDYPHADGDRDGQLYGCLCQYTRDLTAAWAGVEKLGITYIQWINVVDHQEVWVHKEDKRWKGCGATPAEALVRSLLEAVKK